MGRRNKNGPRLRTDESERTLRHLRAHARGHGVRYTAPVVAQELFEEGHGILDVVESFRMTFERGSPSSNRRYRANLTFYGNGALLGANFEQRDTTGKPLATTGTTVATAPRALARFIAWVDALERGAPA